MASMIGNSQNFFRARRKAQISLRNDMLIVSNISMNQLDVRQDAGLPNRKADGRISWGRSHLGDIDPSVHRLDNNMRQ
jgi:hypothetical protein